MPSFTSAFLALAIASVSSATPVRRTPAKAAFTLEQSVPKPFLPGPAQLMRAYQKFGADVPASVAAAASDGSVTATPEQYDSEYLCPVTIGGQTLNLDFDTGSADLWVA